MATHASEARTWKTSGMERRPRRSCPRAGATLENIGDGPRPARDARRETPNPFAATTAAAPSSAMQVFATTASSLGGG